MNKAPDFPVNNQTYSRMKKHCGNGKNHKNVKSVKMIVENRVKNLNYSEGCNKVNEDCKCVKLYINQIIFKSSKKVSAQSLKKVAMLLEKYISNLTNLWNY